MTKPVFDEVAPTARQLPSVGQEIAFRRLANRGIVGTFQLVPPSAVARTSPELDDVAPTAEQLVFVGQDTPLRP